MIRKIKLFFEKRNIKKNGSKIEITILENNKLLKIEFRADKLDIDYQVYWKGDNKFQVKAIGKEDKIL